MHARNWCALLWLGLVGVGCGPSQGDELSREPVSTAPVEEDSRDVTAQACPPGLASRVAAVMTPGVEGFMAWLTAVQRTLYFTTSAIDAPSVLWRTDGTEAGTVPVKTFPLESYFGPFSLVAVGDTLFFQLSTPATGVELWRSNGTEQGTRLVKDLTPGPGSSELNNLTDVNGRLVFFRRVRQPDTTQRTELWRSNGTSQGTVRLRDFGTTFVWNGTLKVGNALLFATSDDTGTTLWRTDGTSAGTTVVKRLDAGFTPFNVALFEGTPAVFLLADGANNEVWKTDGTPAGTVRLDTFGRPVSLIGTLGAHVYLNSVDSSLATPRLRIDRLSLSGGGKQQVVTLPNPYPGEDVSPSVAAAVSSGNDLYFSIAYTELGPVPPLNVSLWATNGTASGTRQLFPSLPGSDMFAYPLFATGTGQVFFPALPMAGGLRPYFTRGSIATTGRIAEVSAPEEFTRMGNRVYFTAVDDTSLRQLWSVPASFTCPPGPAVAGE
ncbi:hypothetical protein COCOR_01441 [Corallococcus coralloides DSM 2259]|uniref:Lipoprotein n=1 Tax=Corallococcus coralloides (strain ATCC 25202 / DSM 2259 / NBRC 100086 / M2) TaxID=1144275 RepID=H8MV92_CORCM|nr:ELWxxDGT repeat protein [Corallococcus coralloides]AFE04064.1 hypothetical protein COCOR_01441 [Corallococcus coralloides DSM 2259]